MASPATEASARPAPLAGWRGALARVPLAKVAFALIGLGVLLRLAAPFFMDVRSDGNTYAAMGHALLRHGEFVMPWGEVFEWERSPARLSQHYPPLYPALLAGAYAALGFGLWQTKLAAVLVALAVLPVVYFATRDVLGRDVARLTTALVAVEPHLVWVTGTGFSENLVVILFTLTLWAILRSLDDERYVVLAGLFAGLAYLTRSSMGPFFLIAGIGGFLWRFYYMRWRVFTSRPYLLAILIFGSMVLLWAARNVLAHGWPHWETSAYTTYVTAYALENLDRFATGLGYKALLFAGFALVFLLPFAPEARRALARAREERVSALWLAVVLTFVLGGVFTTLFWVYEKTNPWWLDNHRYVVIANVPLAWLLLSRRREGGWSFNARFLGLSLALLTVSLAAFAIPVQFADVRLADALNARLSAGDEIAVDGKTIKYAFYAYLERHDVSVYGWTCEATARATACPDRPHFILSIEDGATYPGYRRVATSEVAYWNCGRMTAALWEREDLHRSPAPVPAPPAEHPLCRAREAVRALA